MKASYIMEFSATDVKIVAQLLHLGTLQEKPDKALSALEAFRQQAPGVSSDPILHDVYPQTLIAPQEAIMFNGTFYIPV